MAQCNPVLRTSISAYSSAFGVYLVPTYLESSSSANQIRALMTGVVLTQRMRAANFRVARLCCRRSGRGQTHATKSIRQLPPNESYPPGVDNAIDRGSETVTGERDG